jgi:pantoate--beta-alanine ligase
MKIIRSPKAMWVASQKIRKGGLTLGLVPTMGALHEGHLSLIRRASRENDRVAVSIFVNSIQFGPHEDFRRYPRDFRKDARLCAREGADFIFFPRPRAMYPEGFKTYVTVKELSEPLCGAFRPGHFQGVATVVAKLFNIVAPDKAYFGWKDAQQALIIRRLAEDLNIPVKITIMPTMREQDGLAMSSRNQYLNAEQRIRAAIVPEALQKAREMVKRGARDTRAIIKKIKPLIEATATKIDYVSIVDTGNLQRVRRIKNTALLATAVWIGKTRLIDNTILEINK